MKQMGEAAILEMYFKAMPEIARNVAEPLGKVDKITMYGDGNTSKLVKDIVGTFTQVQDGLKESTGVDVQALLSGFLGGNMATKTVQTDEPAATPVTNYQEVAPSENSTSESVIISDSDPFEAEDDSDCPYAE